MASRVLLRQPKNTDCAEFLKVFSRKNILAPFAYPPSTKKDYFQYVARATREGNQRGFLLCERSTGNILGAINISEIVRGRFQSAYLGYYIAKEAEGQGYMSEGLLRVIRYAFQELKLHRLEANIQPENVRSIQLVKKLGFKKEGFSPKYLKIRHAWKDHERWALVKGSIIHS